MERQELTESRERLLSASELDREAGIQPDQRRRLVRLGVLSPRRTRAGHALFVESDVEAAREWKRARRSRAR